MIHHSSHILHSHEDTSLQLTHPTFKSRGSSRLSGTNSYRNTWEILTSNAIPTTQCQANPENTGTACITWRTGEPVHLCVPCISHWRYMHLTLTLHASPKVAKKYSTAMIDSMFNVSPIPSKKDSSDTTKSMLHLCPSVPWEIWYIHINGRVSINGFWHPELLKYSFRYKPVQVPLQFDTFSTRSRDWDTPVSYPTEAHHPHPMAWHPIVGYPFSPFTINPKLEEE